MAASATCVWYSRAAAMASTRYSWKRFGDAAADADRVERERDEERQARPLEAPVARVPRAAERHNNNNEAVGREPVPPLPSRFILTAHPRPHAGFSFAHDCCVSQSRLLRVLPLIPHSRCCNNTLLQTEHVECLLVCAGTCGRGCVQVRALQ